MAKIPPAVEIKPGAGGRLMAGLSAEGAGLANYNIKRDWRRVLEREVRAEGHTGLVLNLAVPTNLQVSPAATLQLAGAGTAAANGLYIFNNTTTRYETASVLGAYHAIYQVYPGLWYLTYYNGLGGGDVLYSAPSPDGPWAVNGLDGNSPAPTATRVGAGGLPLTVIAQARRGDGKRVIVAGNAATLWAYTALEDTHYVLNDAGAADYFLNDGGAYVDETQYGWLQIASGLSSSGRRWEAVAVGDYLVLNNGVDLPLTYRPGDLTAVPIYELREQQVSSVGTIAVHNSNLVCGDLWQINDEEFNALMAPIASAVPASQDATGAVSQDVLRLFPSATVNLGQTLFWDNGAAAKVIAIGLGYNSAENTGLVYTGSPTPLANAFTTFHYTGGLNSNFAIGQTVKISGGGVQVTLVIAAMVGGTYRGISGTPLFGPGDSAVGATLPVGALFYVQGNIITTDSVQAIASGTISLENQASYNAFTNTAAMQRFPWRVLPSMPGQPRRFGSIVPVSARLHDRQLIFKYPVRSLPELVRNNQAGGYSTTTGAGGPTDIVVLFAGVAGSTLSTRIIGLRNDITMSCQIADAVQSPIYATSDIPASVEALDAADSYAGTFIDLVDDGGAIVKMLALRDLLVVYKETPFLFLGTFTGDTVTPYQFQKIAIANEGCALQYRNTLIASGGGFYGSCHIYAARNAFYKFDLYTQTPMEIPELQSCQEIFFNAAVRDKENAFVAENPLTREWVWGWDGAGADTALCFDYAYRTCRTTSADMRAAGMVQHPTRNDWLFLFGDGSGSVQRYGLWDAPVETPSVTVTLAGGNATTSGAFWTTAHVGKTILLATGDIVAITGYTSATVVTVTGTAPNTTGANLFSVLPGIWHRNTAAYDSILESGLGDLGMADMEKLVTRYVAVASSRSPNSAITVNFKSALNPGSPVFGQSATIVAPQSGHNLVQPTFLGYYVGAKLTVSGVNNPFELVNQIWQIGSVNSKSAGRL